MWDGKVQIFDKASFLESACIQEACEGALVLCVTGRLSRRLLHVCRMDKISNCVSGWQTPRIMAFRRWIWECYEALWDSRRPLTRSASQKLWHEAFADLPVPDGLDVRPSLYKEFQSSLDALMDNGLESSGSETGYELADFRRAVTKQFFLLVDKEEFILWPGIIQVVSKAFEQQQIAVPKRIILAGFDGFSSLDERFLTVLMELTDVVLFQASAQLDPSARVRVYASPEQECMAVCAEVVRIWNGGTKNLGIIFLDRHYFPLLKRCFDELAGNEHPEFERAIRYNLTVGTQLVEHPLFQTAVIPLRVLSNPAPAPLFASFLVSPYIKKIGDNWDRNIRKALWESDELLTFAHILRTLAKLNFPVAGFRRLAAMKKARLDDWLRSLENCWEYFDFPIFDGERRPTDALARQHLENVMSELSRDAGEVIVDGAGALAWLTSSAGNVVISEKTSEITGIQVLNLAESRGLSFDRTWVVGTHGAELPQPAREWPLLDPDERRIMDNGSPELQWEHGRSDLGCLCVSAPDISFSRAVSSGDELPYLPCPLILDESFPDGRLMQRHVDLWENPPAEWMRAQWLRQGHNAIASSENTVSKMRAPVPDVLAREWSVTALEDIAACPFRFFSTWVLQLKPLIKPIAGIDPLIRGEVIHDILKIFVDGLKAKAPLWPDDGGAALAWLKEAADSEFAKQSDDTDIFWQVERIRLIGEKGKPGILEIWLEEERKRARDKWRFKGTEVVFAGLETAGLTLRGRIDRVDCNEAEGFAVLDYKSGTAPKASEVLSGVAQPQLPAYILALKNGLLRGCEPGNMHIHAGYISLKKAADVQIKFINSGKRGDVDWPAFFQEWENKLSDRLKAPRKGFFNTEPSPASAALFKKKGGACQYCEFYNICGYFDQKDE